MGSCYIKETSSGENGKNEMNLYLIQPIRTGKK